MYILSMEPVGHDTSACLLKDGEIVAAAEEERFVRIKHALNMFPINSIKYCLNYAGIILEDVDYIACPWASKSDRIKKMLPYLINNFGLLNKHQGIKNTLYDFAYSLRPFYPSKINPNLVKNFEIKKNLPKIKYVPHALSHCASAYYPSPFKKSSILNIEGCAEFSSTTLAEGDNETINILGEVYKPHSAGMFYAFFTEYLGYKMNNDEFKVMGLAAYGIPKYDLSKLIYPTKKGFKIDKVIDEIMIQGKPIPRWFIRKYGKPKKNINDFSQKDKNLASSMQKRLESIALHLVKLLSNKTSVDNICMTGGVALNCKMNGELLNSGYIKNMFVQPVANDAGVPLGAALHLYKQLGYNLKYKMTHVYLGPEYSNEQIKECLDKRKLKYNYYKDIAGKAAELISRNKIVGWFQGRMEFGPRALGNRSILANPANPKMKDIINKNVKYREEYRPYCPSLLDEYRDEYLDNSCYSPFMNIAFKVKEGKQREIPSVVHIDGTVRPQTVKKEVNPLFYELIKKVHGETGIPVVLNTSFNSREPIVCNPEEAIKCYFGTGMDAVAIGNYLLQKK